MSEHCEFCDEDFEPDVAVARLNGKVICTPCYKKERFGDSE